jgi:hypothetical protein
LIDTSSLHCQHGKIIYDLESDDLDHEICILVNESEWKFLIASYELKGLELPIQKYRTRNYTAIGCILGLCADCRKERISNYKKGTILVVKREIVNEEEPLIIDVEKEARRKRSANAKRVVQLRVVIWPTMTLKELMFEVNWL